MKLYFYCDDSLSKRIKSYNYFKYTLAIVEIIYTLILVFAFLFLGLSLKLLKQIHYFITNKYLAIIFYTLILYFLYYLFTFPLNLYRSFILEHKFFLSNQKIKDWLKDQFKVLLISGLILIILVEFFYFILFKSKHNWWWQISLFWIFFSLILTRLMPVLIIPLFFKYKKISDEQLKERIINLAKKMKIKILDVFEIDFSKKTLKANAGLVGLGKNRRVILADTLKDKYTHIEIEVILAHEFAHYKMKHLLKLIFINAFFIFILFYLIFISSDYILNFFGLKSLSDLASLPVIFLYFLLYEVITQPFKNYFSRRFEKSADIMALKTTGLKDEFISLLKKLSLQNLSDPNPNFLIKFFFFDHPPLAERLKIAQSL